MTCEHAGNYIPAKWEEKISIPKSELQSHKGWDIGAFAVFEELKSLADANFYTKTSRLLIEANRSLHHPNLFSKYSKALSKEEREELINDHYQPYRFAVEQWIEKQTEPVLHLSVHSFTNQLNGVVRNCDIGFLYDPKIATEKEFALLWKMQLAIEEPSIRVRMNYPYKGTADGFTTHLRRLFPRNYGGIEIEINQKLTSEAPVAIAETLRQTLFNALTLQKAL